MEFFEMKFDESLLADYEDRTRGVGCFDATNGPDIKINPAELQQSTMMNVKNKTTGLKINNANQKKFK